MSSHRRAALLAAVALGAAAAASAGPCKTYTGTFTAVAPADCSSPVGICTHGTLAGGFPSTYDFVADTLVPTGDDGEFTYTGHSVITTTQGAQLFGSDSGHITFEPDGTAPFVTTVQIVGGTRQYEGATGQFVAPGVLDLATGATVGSYTARICKDEDAQ
jgi:hypothetical protein